MRDNFLAGLYYFTFPPAAYESACFLALPKQCCGLAWLFCACSCRWSPRPDWELLEEAALPVPCGSGWWCLVTECGAARAQAGQELVQHPRDACPARELGRLSQAQPSSSEVRP